MSEDDDDDDDDEDEDGESKAKQRSEGNEMIFKTQQQRRRETRNGELCLDEMRPFGVCQMRS